MAKAFFVCHIGPNFQISLIYASIGCPQSVGFPTDYGHPEKKLPSLNGGKFTPTLKFLGMIEAYFVCHIGPNS